MTEYNDRVAKVAVDIIDTVKDRLAAHDVNHAEYRAAWAWLMKLANSGEVPLFLDVFFEAAVERITFDALPGSQGTVQGPYHQPDHQELVAPYKLPMRPDEIGTPAIFTGRIVDLNGAPVAGARVDVWHSGNDGTYSGYVGDAPKGNLRGVMRTDNDGGFQFASIMPAPYEIPKAGPTGEFLEMMGRHTWRPAHFHFIIDAPGHDRLITQIYFRGDEVLESLGDCVDAIKDSLIAEVGESADTALAARYSLTTPFKTVGYKFALRPAV